MRHPGSIACVAALLCAAPAPAPGEEAVASADDLTVVALAVALSCSAAPEAAGGARAPAAAGGAGSARTELAATVRARALRFDLLPEAEPLLLLAARTVWRAERLNLPARPEPGVVYRDVEVRLTVSGDLDDLAALLAEARRAARGIRIEPEPHPEPAAPPP